jgi:hypothetical protein
MGGVKRAKTCIASKFSDALDTVGRLLSVLGCCGCARSGGGRCRRCRGCRGCCRRLRGLVSIFRTSSLSRVTSISLSIALGLLKGMALVCAVSSAHRSNRSLQDDNGRW